MSYPTSSSPPVPVQQIPKRRKRSRVLAMSGGMMALDWLFLVICGLALGLALVAISVLTALV